MKYSYEILQPPLSLSAHIIEGRLKIMGKSPKSEEIISFYSILFVHFADFYYIANTLTRTAMFWLQYFITLILIFNRYNNY